MGSLGSLQLYAHVLPPPDTELPADSLSKHHGSLPARPWSGTDVEKGSWCVGCAFQELGKEEQALRLARSKGVSLPHPQASGLGLTNALCSEQKWIQLKMQKRGRTFSWKPPTLILMLHLSFRFTALDVALEGCGDVGKGRLGRGSLQHPHLGPDVH